MPLKDRKVIALTGASGFLGSYVKDSLLQKGYKVIEITRYKGYDITMLSDLENLPYFDLMVHCAAKVFVPDSYKNSAAFYHTNVTGTINCLEICRKYKADMIYISSYVYGEPKYFPIDEKHPTSVWNPYAATKLIGEELVESYCRSFDLNSCILRVFNLYGEGQNPNFVIPRIIAGIKAGALELQTAVPKRDFVYVKDVADFILKCITSDFISTNIFNLGYGKSYSIGEVADLILQIMASDLKPVYKETNRKADLDDVIANIEKAKNEMNWIPQFDLEDGLRDMIKLEVLTNVDKL
jgi:nucleoside-diphosphate-sugar epimerase